MFLIDKKKQTALWGNVGSLVQTIENMEKIGSRFTLSFLSFGRNGFAIEAANKV